MRKTLSDHHKLIFITEYGKCHGHPELPLNLLSYTLALSLPHVGITHINLLLLSISLSLSLPPTRWYYTYQLVTVIHHTL